MCQLRADPTFYQLSYIPALKDGLGEGCRDKGLFICLLLLLLFFCVFFFFFLGGSGGEGKLLVGLMVM